ncbi:hypothetical protein [Actinocrispum sp. NPDC049592]|uniref:hypothetical protein n=1 Tax=Actinocrispum sp. NPDC049592 TaxID=3154835 RepID=UPI0034424322
MPPLVSLASVEDVQARADHPLTDEERSRTTALLADAAAIAYTYVPDISTPPPPTAVGVVCTAVLRALASPADGIRSETVGGYSRTVAHEGGGLYFTEAELDLLRPPRSQPRGAFSIWTVPPAPSTQTGGG